MPGGSTRSPLPRQQVTLNLSGSSELSKILTSFVVTPSRYDLSQLSLPAKTEVTLKSPFCLLLQILDFKKKFFFFNALRAEV